MNQVKKKLTILRIEKANGTNSIQKVVLIIILHLPCQILNLILNSN